MSKAALGMPANELDLSELPSGVHSRCTMSVDGWLGLDRSVSLSSQGAGYFNVLLT